MNAYPARLYLDKDLDVTEFSVYAETCVAARDAIENAIRRTMILQHSVTVELLPDPNDGARRATIVVRCWSGECQCL